MTETDILYRAFGEMFKALAKEPSAARLIDAISSAPEAESITVTHKVCKIDTDWITAIEKGLVFVGKALDENRQFIRSDGEVKPIERVRHVSKESVQYLSRHSDLITREQKDDIIPDKLYTVEKESDYAVYENKFLYLLLEYIKHFVGVRYTAITNVLKEYRGVYEANKDIKAPARKMKLSLKLVDEQEDALAVSTDEECAKAISRMDKILQSVAFYLRTPIMQEVSHSSRIYGKITKTNVLMKDKNFFGALNLYEYLLAYDSDGYSVETCMDTYTPGEQETRELAVPTLLAAFIVYEHGLHLESYLKAEFDKEELKRAEEKQKELLKKLDSLKKKLARSGEGLENYLDMLEQRNAILENSYSLLQQALKKIEELEGKIARLESEIAILNEEIEKLNDKNRELEEKIVSMQEEHKREIEELTHRYEEEIASIKTKYEEELSKLKEEYEEEINTLKAAHAEEIARLTQESERQLKELKEAHAAELEAINKRAKEESERLKKQCEERISQLNEAQKKELDKLKAEQKSKIDAMKADKDKEISKLKKDYDKRLAESAEKLKESVNRAQNTVSELSNIKEELIFTCKERDVLQARLTAIRKEHGLLDEGDDFTTEEGFNALEHEFEVLGKLLNDEWKGVKVALRKEILGGGHKKRAQKSKEYRELKGFVEGQRAQADSNQKSDNLTQNEVHQAKTQDEVPNSADSEADNGATDVQNSDDSVGSDGAQNVDNSDNITEGASVENTDNATDGNSVEDNDNVTNGDDSGDK